MCVGFPPDVCQGFGPGMRMVCAGIAQGLHKAGARLGRVCAGCSQHVYAAFAQGVRKVCGSAWALFVCLLVCLFVCFFVCLFVFVFALFLFVF